MRIVEANGPITLLRFLPNGQLLIATKPRKQQLSAIEILRLPSDDRTPLQNLGKLTLDRTSQIAIDSAGEHIWMAGIKLGQWRLSDGVRIATLRISATALSVAPNGEQLLVVTDRSSLGFGLRRATIINAALANLDYWSVTSVDRIELAGFLPDGKRYLVFDGKRWRLRTLEATPDEEQDEAKAHAAQGQDRAVISPDGRYLATHGSNAIYFHTTDAMGKAHRFSCGSQTWFRALAFHPNNRVFAYIDRADTLVKFIDVATLTPIRKLSWKIGPLTTIAFSPDGTLAAVGGERGQILIWDFDE